MTTRLTPSPLASQVLELVEPLFLLGEHRPVHALPGHLQRVGPRHAAVLLVCVRHVLAPDLLAASRTGAVCVHYLRPGHDAVRAPPPLHATVYEAAVCHVLPPH